MSVLSRPVSPGAIADLIAAIPKCELHVHLEGTLEPELKFAIARRNGLHLPYATVAEMRDGYRYHDLTSFLKVYYEGCTVLATERDFYDLCHAFLTKAASQNIIYVEMFFDPQQHLSQGVAFADMMSGITRARADAEREFGIASQLILCILRETSEASALETLALAMPYRNDIVGVGLDSEERGNPPAKFATFFARARAAGFRLTAHCDVDQENCTQSLREVLVDIAVDRIDHGVNVLDDPELIALARQRGVAFTICPYGNEVVRPGHRQAPVRRMLDLGLKITLNSDDPAYMCDHYLAECIALAQREAGLSREEIVLLVVNAFDAAWIDRDRREAMLVRVASVCAAHGVAMPAGSPVRL